MKAKTFAVLFALLATNTFAAAEDEFVLASNCPPGFQNVAQRCQWRSPYQLYESLQNSGVGGLKTAMPKVRDGFSAQQIDLGRYLFFDPILSGNQTQACASCHQPHLGFADGQARSVGAEGATVSRSAPSLWNVAFMQRFFWDGRANDLETQMQGPLYDPKEMVATPAQLLQRLNDSENYRRLFHEAFPRNKNRIELDQIYQALAAFESSLVSLNSRYDWYAHGYHQALSANEIEGMNVFRSFVARCAECHTPPLFSNQQIAVIGVPTPSDLPFDIGAEAVSKEKTQRGGFKVPSLRNISKTAPYMHAGQFANLRDTVQFYTKGRGHAVPADQQLTLHWHIWEPNLSEQEIDRLVDFLQTLTDESFMPRVPEKLPSGLAPVYRMPSQQ